MFDLTRTPGIQLVLALILFGSAMVRGAAPERMLAGTLLIVAGLSTALSPAAQYASHYASYGKIMVIDVLAFGLLCVVALRANRVYPVWLGSAQLVKLTSHMWQISLSRPVLAAHEILHQAVLYVQIAIMCVGLVSHIARSRRLRNTYPDWSPQPPLD